MYNSTYVNATVTDDVAVRTAILEWNGTNYTMTQGAGTAWYYNVSYLIYGNYTYRVHARDTSGNWNTSETRRLYYGPRPIATALTPANFSLDPDGTVFFFT